MPILGVDPSTVPERENVAAGRYEVRLTSLKYLDDENKHIVGKDSGRKLIKGTLKILNETANTVFFNLMQNVKGDSDDFIQMNQEHIANFTRMFGLPDESEEAMCEAGPGAEGTCLLKLTISPEYGDKNDVDTNGFKSA